MKLSDIMGGTGLSGYAMVGMILFILVFLSLGLRMWYQSRNGDLDGMENMPLSDGDQVDKPGK
jgi:hypothetical protein